VTDIFAHSIYDAIPMRHNNDRRIVHRVEFMSLAEAEKNPGLRGRKDRVGYCRGGRRKSCALVPGARSLGRFCEALHSKESFFLIAGTFPVPGGFAEIPKAHSDFQHAARPWRNVFGN